MTLPEGKDFLELVRGRASGLTEGGTALIDETVAAFLVKAPEPFVAGGTGYLEISAKRAEALLLAQVGLDEGSSLLHSGTLFPGHRRISLMPPFQAQNCGKL